jgi:hypothetical protein
MGNIPLPQLAQNPEWSLRETVWHFGQIVAMVIELRIEARLVSI